jgi:hypothetical protein
MIHLTANNFPFLWVWHSPSYRWNVLRGDGHCGDGRGQAGVAPPPGPPHQLRLLPGPQEVRLRLLLPRQEDRRRLRWRDGTLYIRDGTFRFLVKKCNSSE